MSEPAESPRQRRPRPTGSRRVNPPTGDRGVSALDATPPPRSRRGSATRQEILAAARVVFARMGYGGTRFEDIAAEAGTSRTALYHHFSSRRDIFIEVGRTAVIGYREVLASARATPTAWTVDDLDRLIAAQLAFLDEHGAVIPTWTQATWDDPELRDVGLSSQLRDFAALGRELGRLRGVADVDPIHDGIVFTGMIERLWYFARNGGAATIDDAEMRRTLRIRLEAMLRVAIG